jgi:hypothetical protein
MSGLLPRLRRRRASGPPPPAAPPATVAPTPPAPVADPVPASPPAAAETPAARPEQGETGFLRRGRLRRRGRYLRRLRELALRDLGGLVFDLHRFERSRDDLVRGKLDALTAIDAELRAIDAALGDPSPTHELREPGIVGCAACGALHGSEDRYCPACGTATASADPAGLPGP